MRLDDGARGDREKKILRERERLIPELAITAAVWDTAFELARRCRIAGVTVPAADLLVYAFASHHGADLEHADDDFVRISGVVR